MVSSTWRPTWTLSSGSVFRNRPLHVPGSAATASEANTIKCSGHQGSSGKDSNLIHSQYKYKCLQKRVCAKVGPGLSASLSPSEVQLGSTGKVLPGGVSAVQGAQHSRSYPCSAGCRVCRRVLRRSRGWKSRVEQVPLMEPHRNALIPGCSCGTRRHGVSRSAFTQTWPKVSLHQAHSNEPVRSVARSKPS